MALQFSSPTVSGSITGTLDTSGDSNLQVEGSDVSASNPVPVKGHGTAGAPAGGVVSVQGVDGGTNLPVAEALFPLTPEVDVYTPTGAAYMKVTPTSDVLELVVRPRVTTEALIYAPIVTHKIADTTTTIGAADPDDLPKSKTAIDEILADTNTHIASLTYHVAAGAAWISGHKETDPTNITGAVADMSSLATGYTLADKLAAIVSAHALSTTYHLAASTYSFTGIPDDEPKLRIKVNALRTAMLAHFASTTAHNVADVENLRLVTATTVGSDEASDQTLINLLKIYWNSHAAQGDATAADLPAVIVGANAAKAGILAHMADTSAAHGGVGDATQYAVLLAVADASDLATSITLIHALKDTYNAHCAIVDGGAYITAGAAGLPIVWRCRGSFFAKTNGPGVFTAAEFKSA